MQKLAMGDPLAQFNLFIYLFCGCAPPSLRSTSRSECQIDIELHFLLLPCLHLYLHLYPSGFSMAATFNVTCIFLSLSLPLLKSEENNHKRNGKNACKVSLLSAFLFVSRSFSPIAKILKISDKHTRSTKRKLFPCCFSFSTPASIFFHFYYYLCFFPYFSNTQVF